MDTAEQQKAKMRDSGGGLTYASGNPAKGSGENFERVGLDSEFSMASGQNPEYFKDWTNRLAVFEDFRANLGGMG